MYRQFTLRVVAGSFRAKCFFDQLVRSATRVKRALSFGLLLASSTTAIAQDASPNRTT